MGDVLYRLEVPTALLAPIPFSGPQTSANNSLQPLITWHSGLISSNNDHVLLSACCNCVCCTCTQYIVYVPVHTLTMTVYIVYQQCNYTHNYNTCMLYVYTVYCIAMYTAHVLTNYSNIFYTHIYIYMIKYRLSPWGASQSPLCS